MIRKTIIYLVMPHIENFGFVEINMACTRYKAVRKFARKALGLIITRPEAYIIFKKLKQVRV